MIKADTFHPGWCAREADCLDIIRFDRGWNLAREKYMEYVKAARVEDLEHRTHKTIRLFGRLLAIVKRDDGSFFAVESACKHQRADLMENYTGGTIAVCPRHHWKYDLESGKCLSNDSLPLKRYDLKIRDGFFFVSTTPTSADDEWSDDDLNPSFEWIRREV